MERTDKPVDRETLYDEVRADPVSVVAPRYGLSDVGLAKICRALAIPLPSRGYWAKVKAGRVMWHAPLPKLKPSGPVPTGLVNLPPEKAASRRVARQSVAKIRKETGPSSQNAAARRHRCHTNLSLQTSSLGLTTTLVSALCPSAG